MSDDGLDAARGLLVGLLIGVAFWAAGIAAFFHFTGGDRDADTHQHEHEG